MIPCKASADGGQLLSIGWAALDLQVYCDATINDLYEEVFSLSVLSGSGHCSSSDASFRKGTNLLSQF